MRKLVVIICILFVAVIAAAILYFTNLSPRDRTHHHALTAVPADAAFLVSFQNEKSFYNIFADFTIFKAIIGKKVQHELDYLHSHVLRLPDVAELTKKQTFYFSFHPSKEHINWLLTVPFKNKVELDDVRSLLTKSTQDIAAITADTTAEQLYKIQFNELEQPFYIAIKPMAAFISSNHELVLKVLDNNAAHLPASFMEELAQNERKNDNAIFNLHLNHKALYTFINNLTRTKPGNNLQLLEGLKGMSSLNMNFKNDALMFSGLSVLDQSAAAGNYIALYTHQTGIESKLNEILPANTAAYAAFSFADYRRLHSDLTNLLQRRKQLERIHNQLALIRSSKKINIDSTLLNQWGHEFASIELNTRENIGIVQLKDSIAFEQMIAPLSTAVTDHIRRFDNSNLLYYSFGDPMLPFQRSYFTVVAQYLICANTISTLEQFRDRYAAKQLLINTPRYIAFSKLQSNKANITFFIQNQNAASNLKRTLKPAFRQAYTDTTNFNFKDFYAFSYQLAGDNGNFYSNLSAQYTTEETTQLSPEWTANLSSSIHYPPRVLQYNDSTYVVITQDQADRLYAFSSGGKELWRATLSGEILGDIHQLQDNSIVLNTRERLYRFQPDGTPIKGFPIVLPHHASFGATLYRSDQNQVKFFIPAEERILAFDENGKELSEWKNKTVTGHILYDIKTTLLDGFNYVVALTDEGRFYLFNHNGSLVSLIESKQQHAFKNSFGLEITPGSPAASRMVTTDTSGTLLSIYFDKKQSITNLGSWSADHYFTTKNIQGDSIPELIFTDKNQLYTYSSSDSTLLYSHDFDAAISGQPLFFTTRRDYYAVGIATDAKLLYVMDDDGTIIKGFPMQGYPAFYYGKLKKDGHLYALISKDGHQLAAYRMD